MVDTRPTRDMIFMEMAHVIRKRSTCSRGSVGAILVMDRRIVSIGYNGSPVGAPHCTELGCDLPANNHEAGCQRAIHAESNAIAWAARHGQTTLGTTLYCTHGPCLKCAQLILQAGITRVVYGVPYRLMGGFELLALSDKVYIEQFNQEYVQLLEASHSKPRTTAEEQGTPSLPTECQAAEEQAYSTRKASRLHTEPRWGMPDH